MVRALDKKTKKKQKNKKKEKRKEEKRRTFFPPSKPLSQLTYKRTIGLTTFHFISKLMPF